MPILLVILAAVSCKTEQKKDMMKNEKKGGIKVEKTVGIGRLQVSLNKAIPLYRTAQDAIPFDTIHFSVCEAGRQKGSFLAVRASTDTLSPMSFYKGDSEKEAEENINSGLVYFAPQLVFRMTALTNSGFEVVLNEDTFEVAFVKQDEHRTLYTKGEQYWQMNHNSSPHDHPWFLCEQWEDYFKRIWYTYSTEAQLYDSPDGTLSYSSPYYGYFRIKRLMGEWAEVEIQHTYWEEEDKFPKEGWIRWTDGKTLLVDPIEERYE